MNFDYLIFLDHLKSQFRSHPWNICHLNKLQIIHKRWIKSFFITIFNIYSNCLSQTGVILLGLVLAATKTIPEISKRSRQHFYSLTTQLPYNICTSLVLTLTFIWTPREGNCCIKRDNTHAKHLRLLQISLYLLRWCTFISCPISIDISSSLCHSLIIKSHYFDKGVAYYHILHAL